LANHLLIGRAKRPRTQQQYVSEATTMIRPAKIQEAEILTKISFDSKGYWGYPKEFYDVWAKELTINSDYITNNDVFVFEKEGNIIGYYSIVELKDDIEISGIKISKGFWLEHMFIEPWSIGKGIGTKMFDHLRKRCGFRGINELGILADPNTRKFYEKMGCAYKREYPSTIKNRTTPYLQLILGGR
jgi:GNAT superfamily N-acetyltransferase